MMWRGAEVSPVEFHSTFWCRGMRRKKLATDDIQSCAHFHQVVGLTPARSI
jgi:hypothetical protein